MIIRSDITLDRKRSLILIQQHFHQDVIALRLAIEHKLEIGCHRCYLVVEPLGGNLLRILDFLTITIQVEETSERSHHRVMTIAQGRSWMRKRNATVCLLDNVTQEIALRIRLYMTHVW